jgi:hypothetical protein
MISLLNRTLRRIRIKSFSIRKKTVEVQEQLNNFVDGAFPEGLQGLNTPLYQFTVTPSSETIVSVFRDYPDDSAFFIKINLLNIDIQFDPVEKDKIGGKRNNEFIFIVETGKTYNIKISALRHETKNIELIAPSNPRAVSYYNIESNSPEVLKKIVIQELTQEKISELNLTPPSGNKSYLYIISNNNNILSAKTDSNLVLKSGLKIFHPSLYIIQYEFATQGRQQISISIPGYEPGKLTISATKSVYLEVKT